MFIRTLIWTSVNLCHVTNMKTSSWTRVLLYSSSPGWSKSFVVWWIFASLSSSSSGILCGDLLLDLCMLESLNFGSCLNKTIDKTQNSQNSSCCRICAPGSKIFIGWCQVPETKKVFRLTPVNDLKKTLNWTFWTWNKWTCCVWHVKFESLQMLWVRSHSENKTWRWQYVIHVIG